MRRLALGSQFPGDQGFKDWVQNSLREIERASAEDIEAVVSDFKVSGSFTATRTLTPSTATIADLANFIATFISDIKSKGQKRGF